MKITGGKSRSVTKEMASSWSKTTLPTVLLNCKIENIFNAGKFGLFYQCLPDKTYHLKGENCSGGKKSKVRLTGMAAACVTGEKLPIFVIWKSKNPCCFKNVKHLPCEYKSKKKSWMNSEIFEEWFGKLDQKFRVDDQKIALIIHNSPAQPSVSSLTNVQIVFLPQNTTSILQQMSQSVTRSLKAHYQGRVVRLLCRGLEKKEPCPKISILQSVKILADYWEVVTKETIINCFRKAGITPFVQQAAIADSDDPFKDLQESLNDLRKSDSPMVPDGVTATALVSLDDDNIATAHKISEGDIIEELRDNQEQGEEEENDDEISIEEIFDPVVEKSSRSAIESALDGLKDAAMFSDEDMQMKRLLLSFQRLYENERLKCLKQRDIADSFTPV